MSPVLDEIAAAKEPVKEPAKRWRNWWRTSKLIISVCPDCKAGRMLGPGEDFPSHCITYTSKVSAEIGTKRERDGRPHMTWLGAYPEGERP